MADKIRVTIWNENVHEKRNPQVAAIYPTGIHGKIAEMMADDDRFEITAVSMDMPEQGLTEELLDRTDVLVWWGHCAHAQLEDAIAERVRSRVLSGMGFVALHASKSSKPFKLLMGTTGALKYRVDGERERIWCVDPSHPIADGLPEYIELPQEEMYGEFVDLPAPDELVFISWFEGGEVFRSGCCYKRGRGRLFYFRPGHETYPIFHNPQVIQVIKNACVWAKPTNGPKATTGNYAMR